MLQKQLTFDTKTTRIPIKSFEYSWKFSRFRGAAATVLLFALVILLVIAGSWLFTLSAEEYNYLLKTFNGIC